RHGFFCLSVGSAEFGSDAKSCVPILWTRRRGQRTEFGTPLKRLYWNAGNAFGHRAASFISSNTGTRNPSPYRSESTFAFRPAFSLLAVTTFSSPKSTTH